MTDPDLSPEQDAVRRLLAHARHDEPIPDEVAARLDATLAELTNESGRSSVPVVDLAARRRRRRASALLAAAALVVGGVGVSQILDHAPTSSDTTASADRAGGGAAESLASPEAAAPKEGDSELHSGEAFARQALPQVRSDHLRSDLQSMQSRVITPYSSDWQADSSGIECAVDLPAGGDRAMVLLDGEPAVALFGEVSGGRQTVTLRRCGNVGQPLTVELRSR